MATQRPIRLERGSAEIALEPVALVVEDYDFYVWFGNNGETDRRCFATMNGSQALRLAKRILAAHRRSRAKAQPKDGGRPL